MCRTVVTGDSLPSVEEMYQLFRNYMRSFLLKFVFRRWIFVKWLAKITCYDLYLDSRAVFELGSLVFYLVLRVPFLIRTIQLDAVAKCYRLQPKLTISPRCQNHLNRACYSLLSLRWQRLSKRKITKRANYKDEYFDVKKIRAV